MSALRAAFEALVDAAGSDPVVPVHVDHAAMAVLQLATQAAPEELAELVAALEVLIRDAPLATSGSVAMVAGALVEQGAPAAPIGDALLARLPDVLASAAAFAAAVEALDQAGADGEEGLWVGDRFAPAAWVHARFEAAPDQVHAWLQLRHFCLPAIAAATHDREVLARFVAMDEPIGLGRLRQLDPHARFLWVLHGLLLDAPLRVVELESRRVFDLRIDTVATNFELHTLVHDALASALDEDPPDAGIVACLQGRGPRHLVQKSSSRWALYGPGAMPALVAGRKAEMADWVWNESIPAEIPVHDGIRTLIAGHQSYARQWETGRTFGALGGAVSLARELPEAEAARFLDGLVPN